MRSRVLWGYLIIVLAAGTLSAQITGDVIGVHNLGEAVSHYGYVEQLLFVLPCSPFRDRKVGHFGIRSSRPRPTLRMAAPLTLRKAIPSLR